MSWLLFMDESGHDHHNMPYEVRGGIAVHAGRLWPLVRGLQALEVECFGAELNAFKKEFKGHNLLDKERFGWSNQMPWMPDEERRKNALAFLNRSAAKDTLTREQFTAYGQACLTMARGIFQLLWDHQAVLFASAIPRGVKKPAGYMDGVYLRKDHVFLLERFFFFLESKKEHGLLVVDETETQNDRRWVRDLQTYFSSTQTGKFRTAWIVPTPFFVASHMAQPVQLADVCIYCLNWGFRRPHGMNAPTRPEIAQEFEDWLFRLQFVGDGYRDGMTYREFGVVYVPDPYTAR